MRHNLVCMQSGKVGYSKFSTLRKHSHRIKLKLFILCFFCVHMELSLSSSSLGGSALIPRYRPSSSLTKLNTKFSNSPAKFSNKSFCQTLGLRGTSRCSKPLSNGHQWGNSIRVLLDFFQNFTLTL